MNVEVLNEVQNRNGLCFQQCRWHGDNGEPNLGYRFIWRDLVSGRLKASRGQAWIPDEATITDLLASATAAGWLE